MLSKNMLGLLRVIERAGEIEFKPNQYVCGYHINSFDALLNRELIRETNSYEGRQFFGLTPAGRAALEVSNEVE